MVITLAIVQASQLAVIIWYACVSHGTAHLLSPLLQVTLHPAHSLITFYGVHLVYHLQIRASSHSQTLPYLFSHHQGPSLECCVTFDNFTRHCSIAGHKSVNVRFFVTLTYSLLTTVTCTSTESSCCGAPRKCEEFSCPLTSVKNALSSQLLLDKQSTQTLNI